MGGRIFEVIGNKRVWEEGCHFKRNGKDFFRVEEAAIKKKKKKKGKADCCYYDFLSSSGCY